MTKGAIYGHFASKEDLMLSALEAAPAPDYSTTLGDESRPLRERPWEYYFFLDLKGHRREARVARALAAVERRALRLKVLGSYAAAPDPEL